MTIMSKKAAAWSATFVLAVGVLFCMGCGPDVGERLNHVKAQAGEVNSALVAAKSGVETLRDKAIAAYANSDGNETPPPPDGYYKYHDEKVYYKAIDDGLCGIWASGFTPIGAKERADIDLLAQLQSDIKQVSTSQEFVEQVYVFSKDHVAIFFPYFLWFSFLEPGTNFGEAYKPYYEAAPTLNPEHGTVWIKPYIDIVGNGNICSVSAPIYSNGEFKGVAGSDILLLALGEKVLDQDKHQMLLSDDSLLISVTEPMSHTLHVEGLRKFYYTEKVETDKFASDDFKLLNNPSTEVQELAKRAMQDEQFRITLDGQEYHVVSAPVQETNWRVVELIKP